GGGGVVGRGRLAGPGCLISAGGTREPIDAVRFVGNRSSGRMGVALAEEARRRGADVTLLAANLAVPAPAGVTVVETPAAADMEREALARADADVVIMAAAVADCRPAAELAGKRPKDSDAWALELEPTTDVLRALGERRQNGQVLVGFAAEAGGDGLARAAEKLERKRLDLLVYNDVSANGLGFDSDENEVVILSGDGRREVPRAPKTEIAAAGRDEVERGVGGARWTRVARRARQGRRPGCWTRWPRPSAASCTRRRRLCASPSCASSARGT